VILISFLKIVVDVKIPLAKFFLRSEVDLIEDHNVPIKKKDLVNLFLRKKFIFSKFQIFKLSKKIWLMTFHNTL
jgi:hypothetical protein